MSGCSTTPSVVSKTALPIASICPPPQVYASYNTFTYETKLKAGETPFSTVKRFRLAEKEKNSAGQRLWGGMKACRAKPLAPKGRKPVKEETIADVLAGGL